MDKKSYIGILYYALEEQEDLMYNVLSNISYNVKFLEYLNSSSMYSFNVNYLYQIDIQPDNETIEKIVELISGKEYLTSLEMMENRIYEQLLVNFISARDVYAFISDLLTVYYVLKYLV
jgi:hypothetical protein